MHERHVQATLPADLYEALWQAARREQRPLKALVRDAVEAYLRRTTPTGEDPLLGFVGKGRLKGTDWSERKDWRA